MHPFNMHLGCYQFFSITNETAVKVVYVFLVAHVHAFQLGVELLGHRVYVYSTFKDNVNCCFQ